MTTLTEPLTIDQIREQAGDDNIVTGLVPFDMSELIDNDLEAILDLMSERLVGSSLGMQIDADG